MLVLTFLCPPLFLLVATLLQHLGTCLCNARPLNALPVPLLRQVYKFVFLSPLGSPGGSWGSLGALVVPIGSLWDLFGMILEPFG